MTTYCLKESESVTAHLDRLIGYKKAGLKDHDVLVLGCYVEVACLDPDSASVLLSCVEVSRRTGLSLATTKRATSKLMQSGLLVRRQDVRQSGVIAWTQVTKAACTLFGVGGGASHADGLPSDVKVAMASESVTVCSAVSRAWKACEGFPVDAENLWRGGARRLELVRSYLAARSVEALEQAVATAEHREQAAQEAAHGLVRIPCPQGEEVVIDVKRLDACAPCPADVEFARDVLIELGLRKPDLVTPTSVPRLLAEVLYSRAVGFVAGREYTPAVRVLVSCISSQDRPWGRPRGIWDVWYGASQAACRLSTGGSEMRH